MDSLKKITEKENYINNQCSTTDRLHHLKPNQERLSTEFDDIGIIVMP